VTSAAVPLADVRVEVGARFFAAEAGRLAELCSLMSARFLAGGRLVAFGMQPAARSDARHVAVEFVHPVIVGKRALPALALIDPGAEALVRGDDIAIAFGGAEVREAVAFARAQGCLTIGFTPACGAEHAFEVGSGDPFIDQEIIETLYHVLWELVHVFLDHRGPAAGGRGAGASSFLYPFLDSSRSAEEGSDVLVEDVRRSILMKSDEIGGLRAQTLAEGGSALAAAADALRDVFARGGKLLALGNGGSATDAMDVVADLRAAGLAAIDLTEDPGILTAIANDIGVEAIFQRQVIAYGVAGDALLALSTSGNSTNVIAALGEARRRGLVTIAMVGYDGGRVADEALADFVVVVRSEHIPRIQEAQASAYHALVEMLG
jgi:D-sedoheptulose 7-phosphate isomerase